MQYYIIKKMIWATAQITILWRWTLWRSDHHQLFLTLIALLSKLIGHYICAVLWNLVVVQYSRDTSTYYYQPVPKHWNLKVHSWQSNWEDFAWPVSFSLQLNSKLSECKNCNWESFSVIEEETFFSKKSFIYHHDGTTI